MKCKHIVMFLFLIVSSLLSAEGVYLHAVDKSLSAEINPPVIGQNYQISIYPCYHLDFYLPEDEYIQYYLWHYVVWKVDGQCIAECHGSQAYTFSSYIDGPLWEAGYHVVTAYVYGVFEAQSENGHWQYITTQEDLIGELTVVTVKAGGIEYSDLYAGEPYPDDDEYQTAGNDTTEEIAAVSRCADSSAPTGATWIPTIDETKCDVILKTIPDGFYTNIKGTVDQGELTRKNPIGNVYEYKSPIENKSQIGVPKFCSLSIKSMPIPSNNRNDEEIKQIEMSSTKLKLYSVFQYRREIKRQFTRAAKYANWKYDIGAINFSYSNTISENPNIIAICEDGIIRFNKSACKNEWRCASVLLHEKFHQSVTNAQRLVWAQELGSSTAAASYEELRAHFVEKEHSNDENGKTQPITYIFDYDNQYYNDFVLMGINFYQ